jgi:hypothetical protein
MPFDAFLTPEQWRLEGLEPHHIMRLAISDDDYFQTDYGAGLACGIKQPT